MNRRSLAIVLAAGEGSRMRSAKAKVLHEVAGLPLVAHAVSAARHAQSDSVCVVVGRDAEPVRRLVTRLDPSIRCYVQVERLGTAHAVLSARDAIADGWDDILVLFGDTPLVSSTTLARARQALADGASVCVVGFRTPRPTGYGRLIMSGDELLAIREEKDASDTERAIQLCNAGVMAIAGPQALELLDAVDAQNAKGEFYLTDVVAIAKARGLSVKVTESPFEDVLGVNTRAELATVEAIWQDRKRRELMLAGVTLVAPQTVFLSHDTLIEPDVVVEPNVVFGPGARVASGAVIHAFSHIEGTAIEAGASIGPFARLRPGTSVGQDAKVGNFVETKSVEIGRGAKVSHLTYLGDASIGADTNIGAGTITCNYDGFNKYRTVVGSGAFIGSNASLVAPVRIGNGAYVASGSVVTEDVPDDALALGRARQVTKEGRGRLINERNAARKASKT
ncbi:bifunctional UDP-N-acetylglucosamine diphosphorylase/glucosamine-1-phosphate N-acetyltransferase GlmU [Aureimonas jatrophae]|nr:bifunctional UDP-N-acetylglucosamine diphosphorylase/glucosamine-1-phosphate N-acetyltransferase GlmU [Aureimonas jatrophae]